MKFKPRYIIHLINFTKRNYFYIKIDGKKVKIFKNILLRKIAKDGNNCCKCGIVGNYFEYTIKLGLRLYTDNKKKNFITKDHIIPISKGGPHIDYNLEILCYKCNIKKSNKYNNDIRPYIIKEHLFKWIYELYNVKSNKKKLKEFLKPHRNSIHNKKNISEFNNAVFSYKEFLEFKDNLYKTMTISIFLDELPDNIAIGWMI